ncbi:uncharacterized protein LOC131687220 [Topomyia yanbarensis]|uniref:uncharacterized protein LOC131687220 n=1 Tax=Topomyia yanbarensis TaxID=2498891 RepID=UPI00273ABE2B|nr:uncharacterized protein LOC131687220 [Topomyia yanbarensis]
MDEEGINDDSTDVWTLNIIQKYEKREGLDDICLADFVSCYTKDRSSINTYKRRSIPRIVRWRKYKKTELNDFKREMVLLFQPFRNETCDILDRNNFIELYDQNEAFILNKLKEYDCNINLEHIVEEYLRINEEIESDDLQNETNDKHNEFVRAIVMEPNDDDIEQLPTGALSAVVKKRTNVMSKLEYCAMVRATNVEQRNLILHLIDILHSFDGMNIPLQIFFTGPAGCGKTFTLRILMETYNRFSQSHNSLKYAYVACASTGKAAVAIGGTTVHSAFRITMARRHNSKLGFETLQLYRNAFAGIKAIIIDEVSMIGADVLNTIHSRLQDITGNFDDPFGGIHIIFCGDLRQLPPVNARPVFKPCRNSFQGPVLWQSLNFFPLVQVMRQTDVEFSTILTKIGNGEALTSSETERIESRFRTVDWCRQNVPNAIRLFHRNIDVEKYNTETLRDREGHDFIVDDVFTGYRNAEQLASARSKLHKMSVVETGGLPYLLRLTIGMPYMITTNIDVEDGMVNGAIGELKFIEHGEDDSGEHISRLWMKFESDVIGTTLKIKSRPLVYSKPGQLQFGWVPLTKRSASIKLGSITCKRIQFPVVSACALTVHKSQGGTFSEVVFDYDKSLEQQLVYVGLSRVTSMDGLYLTNSKNNFKFNHCKSSNTPRIVELRTELERLSNHQLPTISGVLLDFIEQADHSCSLISFNVQSLNAHSSDISTDNLLTKVDILSISETWLNNCSAVDIIGYSCIAESKRPHSRAGGVAIYQRTTASTMAIVHEIEQVSEEHDENLSLADNNGDICATEVMLKDQYFV